MIEGTKLIKIKYNNKLYDVFIDEEHTKHFLEVKIEDGKEKFYHPNLSDLIKLNLIYNIEKDKKYVKRKKYKFKSNSIKNLKIRYNNIKKVSYYLTRLTNLLICGAIIIGLKHRIDDGNLPDIALGTIEIKNNSEFDDYEINNVSFDETRETLKQNENIPNKYKDLTLEYINLLEKKLPDVDLRILNENLKDMDFKTYNSPKIEGEDAAGSYNANTNTLEISVAYDNKTIKSILFHELTHAMTTFNNKVVITNSKLICNQRIQKQYEEHKYYGEAIDEGFTEVLSNYLLSSSNTLEDYFKDDNKKFIGYSVGIAPTCYSLLKLTQDEYTLYDFVDGNVEEYIKILKKYELEGIIDYLDVIKKSNEERKIEIIDSYEFNEYLKLLKHQINIKEGTVKKDVSNLHKNAYILSKEFK